jgi:hypothetical protein
MACGLVVLPSREIAGKQGQSFATITALMNLDAVVGH